MKKIIISILFLVMFLPIVVNAKNCESKGIIIESIELKNTIGNAEELSDASIKENKINLDLKLYDPGDSIEYNLKVKNTSKDDLFFDENSLKSNSNYIDYDFSYENNSNIIKSKETKLIKLKISYNNKIPEDKLVNDTFNDINQITLKLSDKEIINPNTKNKSILFIFIICILCLIIFAFYKHKISINHMLLLIGITIIIPNSVYALCNYNIEIETKIQIDGKEAYFLTGKDVNAKMKELAGTDTGTIGYQTKDQNIIFIKNSSSEPDISNKEDKNIVSLADSPYPIYMWFDNGTIYWWSEDKTPNVNQDASFMFVYLTNLEKIEGIEKLDVSRTENLSGIFAYNISLKNIYGVENWDTSNVTNMYYAFGSHRSIGEMQIEDLSPLANWDVSNVTNMKSMFLLCTKLTNLHGLENWNVSNVTNMIGIFEECIKLTNIDALKKWNVSNVTEMDFMFMGHPGSGNMILEDISPLTNWDVSNVTSMQAMFNDNTALKDLSPLAKWNVSNVTDMNWMFAGNATDGYECIIEDLTPLKNWNVSSLNSMNHIFRNCRKLTTLHGLENWNVSNVTTMKESFKDLISLQDASAINDWDITHVTDFTNVFYNTPVHPEFSKVSGTWDSNGIFIPN